MGRRIIGGVVTVVIVIVGYFTTSTGYAGHDDPTGKFCQEMLKQNHSAAADVKKLEESKADWSAVAARLHKAAADLDGIDSTDVASNVVSASRRLADAITAVATEDEESKFAAADAAYGTALENMATACNIATGEKVGVEKE